MSRSPYGQTMTDGSCETYLLSCTVELTCFYIDGALPSSRRWTPSEWCWGWRPSGVLPKGRGISASKSFRIRDCSSWEWCCEPGSCWTVMTSVRASHSPNSTPDGAESQCERTALESAHLLLSSMQCTPELQDVADSILNRSSRSFRDARSQLFE